jgi:Lhr-like helicase
MAGTIPEPFAAWFAARGWQPREFQLAVLDAAQAGNSVLLIAPTGGGKTLAGFLPSLIELAPGCTRFMSARSKPSPETSPATCSARSPTWASR